MYGLFALLCISDGLREINWDRTALVRSEC